MSGFLTGMFRRGMGRWMPGWGSSKPEVEQSLPEAELPAAERKEALKRLKQSLEEDNDE